MKLKLITTLFISTSLFAAADCEKSYRFSNRTGDSAIAPTQEFITVGTNLSATSGVYDVRAAGCSNWYFMYDNEGFSALSIQLEDAPSANGVAGTFVAYAGTVLSGSNPATNTASASYSAYGYYPYIRVNLTTVTGTGSINVRLLGWKSPNYLARQATLNASNSFTGTNTFGSNLTSIDNTGHITTFNGFQSSSGGIIRAEIQYSNNGFTLGSDRPFCWSSTTGASATQDTCLWRDAAGAIDFGNATASNKTAQLNYQQWLSTGITFASLGTPTNGTIVYCQDCTIASTCAGSGTGAIAKRLNSIWVCN
jgi:hypothetical protein